MPPERLISCSTSSPRLKARTPSDCRGRSARVRSLDTSHFLPCAASPRDYRRCKREAIAEATVGACAAGIKFAALQRMRCLNAIPWEEFDGDHRARLCRDQLDPARSVGPDG